VVALVLGSAVVVPLHADAGEPPVLPSALDGLPLPDRITAREVTSPLTVRVQVGDTLWGIAAARLPPGAAPAVVDQGWRRIYRHNRSAVGPDPDLLTPGMRLRVSLRR
jgi:nucleoid-associated protein YgaU